eukprot:928717-Prymnesium_polylepis.1
MSAARSASIALISIGFPPPDSASAYARLPVASSGLGGARGSPRCKDSPRCRGSTSCAGEARRA